MNKKVILALLAAITLGVVALVLPELPFTPVAIAGPKQERCPDGTFAPKGGSCGGHEGKDEKPAAASPKEPVPCPPLGTNAAENVRKEKKARRLLVLTGADAMGKQMIESMMVEFAKMSELPAGFAQKFQELAMQEDLVTMIAPVYVRCLDERDLDGAISFYESPAGKSLTKAQPQILTESMAIGQKWGADLAGRAMKSVEFENNTRNALPPTRH